MSAGFGFICVIHVKAEIYYFGLDFHFRGNDKNIKDKSS